MLYDEGSHAYMLCWNFCIDRTETNCVFVVPFHFYSTIRNFKHNFPQIFKLSPCQAMPLKWQYDKRQSFSHRIFVWECEIHWEATYATSCHIWYVFSERAARVIWKSPDLLVDLIIYHLSTLSGAFTQE